jgi:hypothetical protein
VTAGLLICSIGLADPESEGPKWLLKKKEKIKISWLEKPSGQTSKVKDTK